MKSQFVVGGISPRCGKTLFALGLMEYLKGRKTSVMPFKVGPLCGDPQLYTLTGEEPAVNLDAWFLRPTELQQSYNSHGEKADVCIVEGDKALFDGYNCLKGSTADIAKMLGLPVVLVIDAHYQSYSLGAVIYGYKHFRRFSNVVGVVFNRIVSEGQFAYLRQACQDAGVECLGYLPERLEDWGDLPHNGLGRVDRMEWKKRLEGLAQAIGQHVQVDRLLAQTIRIFPCAYSLPFLSETEQDMEPVSRVRPRIAIARDACFYALFNGIIEQWKRKAEVVFFSPLHARELPEADYYYLPGGSVERYAHLIARNRAVLSGLKEKAEAGGCILAEGGAAVLLCAQWENRFIGGPLPLYVYAETQLKYGYRQIVSGDSVLRGYESTYLRLKPTVQAGPTLTCRQVYDLTNTRPDHSLYRYKNVYVSTIQWYWERNDFLALWTEGSK